MDKPEEVKRFDLGQQVSIGTDKDFCKTVMIGVIEGKYVLFEDHAKALATANAKIVELEATQLSLDDICYRKLNSELEAELSTANAKIVDLEVDVEAKRQMAVCSWDEHHMRIRIKELEAELSTANKKAEKLVEAFEPFIKFLNQLEERWFRGVDGLKKERVMALCLRNETFGRETFDLGYFQKLEQAIKEFRGEK